ncbi:unnamed protein product [Lota lota]
MLSRMEVEHKTKLEQLHAMQEQQRSMAISTTDNQSGESKSTPASGHQQSEYTRDATTSIFLEVHESDDLPSHVSTICLQVSLTLEEKQRLAKEQEQASKLRNQQPLAPQAVKPAAASTQAKDLTSSLLLQNKASLNSLSLANTPRPAPVQGTTMSAYPSPSPMMVSMGAPVSNGFNPTMGFQASGMGMCPPGPSLYGGMATTSSTPNFSTLTQNQGALGQTNKTPNMSALDNLFTANKPRATLHQLGSNVAPAANNTPWRNQFGPGQANQTPPVQGVPLGMGGVPSGFGMQANPFFSPQNFSQPSTAPSVTQAALKQTASVNNDLKDLFG